MTIMSCKTIVFFCLACSCLLLASFKILLQQLRVYLPKIKSQHSSKLINAELPDVQIDILVQDIKEKNDLTCLSANITSRVFSCLKLWQTYTVTFLLFFTDFLRLAWKNKYRSFLYHEKSRPYFFAFFINCFI